MTSLVPVEGDVRIPAPSYNKKMRVNSYCPFSIEIGLILGLYWAELLPF